MDEFSLPSPSSASHVTIFPQAKHPTTNPDSLLRHPRPLYSQSSLPTWPLRAEERPHALVLLYITLFDSMPGPYRTPKDGSDEGILQPKYAGHEECKLLETPSIDFSLQHHQTGGDDKFLR